MCKRSDKLQLLKWQHLHLEERKKALFRITFTLMSHWEGQSVKSKLKIQNVQHKLEVTLESEASFIISRASAKEEHHQG